MDIIPSRFNQFPSPFSSNGASPTAPWVIDKNAVGFTADKRASDEKIIDILYNRARTNYVPGSNSDGNNIAYVYEGGGLATVAVAANGAAMKRAGLANAADVHIPSSAAGFVAASLASGGNTVHGTATYFEEASSREFFSLLRLGKYFVRGMLGREQKDKPGMDLDYLFDFLTSQKSDKKFIDLKKVVASKAPVMPVTTDIDDLKLKIVKDISTPQEMLDYMMASCKLPFLTGSSAIPDPRDNHRLIDAKYSRNNAIGPVLQAKNSDGTPTYTHAVMFSTDPINVVRNDAWSLAADELTARSIYLFARTTAEAKILYDFARENIRTTSKEVADGEKASNVLVLDLPQGPRLSALRISAGAMCSAAQSSFTRTCERLGVSSEIPARWIRGSQAAAPSAAH